MTKHARVSVFQDIILCQLKENQNSWENDAVVLLQNDNAMDHGRKWAELYKNDLWEAIRKRFQKFKQFLESDDGLPNFFCPSINLLEGYPQDLIRECSAMAENITERPLDYLPQNFNEVCEYLNKLVQRLDEIEFEHFLGALSNLVKEKEYLRFSTGFEFLSEQLSVGFLEQREKVVNRHDFWY